MDVGPTVSVVISVVRRWTIQLGLTAQNTFSEPSDVEHRATHPSNQEKQGDDWLPPVASRQDTSPEGALSVLSRRDWSHGRIYAAAHPQTADRWFSDVGPTSGWGLAQTEENHCPHTLYTGLTSLGSDSSRDGPDYRHGQTSMSPNTLCTTCTTCAHSVQRRHRRLRQRQTTSHSVFLRPNCYGGWRGSTALIGGVGV